MAYKYRERPCSQCGEIVKGYISPTKPVRCLECGLKVAAETMHQMFNRQGERYDKWLASAGPRGRPRTDLPRG